MNNLEMMQKAAKNIDGLKLSKSKKEPEFLFLELKNNKPTMFVVKCSIEFINRSFTGACESIISAVNLSGQFGPDDVIHEVLGKYMSNLTNVYLENEIK